MPKTTMIEPAASIVLDDLLPSLKEKRCILMLGPRIATIPDEDHGEVPILEGLALEFARQLETLNIPFDKSSSRNLAYVAQMFLRERNVARDDLRKSTKQYVETHARDRLPKIYQELAKLPVRLIVNTTPDDFIVRALQSLGKRPIVFNFNYEVNLGSERGNQDLRDIATVSVQEPLVFNLFGATNDPTSLVVTDSDQVAFVRNVLEGRSRIPQEILNFFTPRNSYLFFGFNLENWQFRLLLKSLQLSDSNETWSPQTDNYPVSEVTKSYLRDEFNFSFLEVGMDEFAQEISRQASSFDINRVYISYSDQDRPALDRLLKTFNPLLKANKNLDLWHRGLITSGDVETQVRENLQKANLVLPLLSTDYLADDLIAQHELPVIEELLAKNRAIVAPVILRSCMWEEYRFLRNLPTLPDDRLPVLGGDRDEDQAYLAVVAAFRKRFL